MSSIKPRKIFIVYLILILSKSLSAQGIDNNVKQICDSSVSPSSSKLIAISGLSAVFFGLSYGLQDNIWWKGEKSAFHFNWRKDWIESKGSDKFGHFFFSRLLARAYSEAFNWAGYSNLESRYLGMGISLLHQTFTEIRDGFSKEYGFSFSDHFFNILGSCQPVLEYYYSFLGNFDFKISYYPSKRFNEGSHNFIIDDYESTYNWISIDLEKMLPSSLSLIIPDFINIAVGHNVKALDYGGRHEIYLSLDWDLKSIKGKCWLINFIENYLNYYHLPAPAVKVYPNVVWYGLKF